MFTIASFLFPLSVKHNVVKNNDKRKKKKEKKRKENQLHKSDLSNTSSIHYHKKYISMTLFKAHKICFISILKYNFFVYVI